MRERIDQREEVLCYEETYLIFWNGKRGFEVGSGTHYNTRAYTFKHDRPFISKPISSHRATEEKYLKVLEKK